MSHNFFVRNGFFLGSLSPLDFIGIESRHHDYVVSWNKETDDLASGIPNLRALLNLLESSQHAFGCSNGSHNKSPPGRDAIMLPLLPACRNRHDLGQHSLGGSHA